MIEQTNVLEIKGRIIDNTNGNISYDDIDDND